MTSIMRTRRDFCELAGLGMVAHALGCGDGSEAASETTGGSTETGATESGTGTGTTALPGSTDTSGVDTSTDEGEGGIDMTTSDGASTSESSDTGEAACEPSPPSIEGPFYRPGMPVRSDLDVYDDPGLPVRMRGRVLDTACAPVANAVVEIWHAAPIPPDTEAEQFDATYDASAEYRYYGQVATDAEGRYAFETLKPGWYLNGPQYRPAHIHVKIWTRDAERLTTQLYFADDPFAAEDPWFDAAMVLVLDEAGEVEFDFTI